jgi:D-beta-D-heptose 7-phosphate kinase/D-beta-D-heptose 1-phosphate adenosyltransferase
MISPKLSAKRVQQILKAATRARILVIGDAMLDQFVWGSVSRISPEAPVPVVDFQRESFMPGGAANVARNLSALGAHAELFAVLGRDDASDRLRDLLRAQEVACEGLITHPSRPTSVKTRIVAQHQQVVRVDRETRGELDSRATSRLMQAIEPRLKQADAVIVGDYGKGVVTQGLLDDLRKQCRERGVWLSLDPKPVHALQLGRLSLLTPNRKEAFELSGLTDDTRETNPLADINLVRTAGRLLNELTPALLLITLGEHGMLLCRRGEKPHHIPTVAQEVFDVSGAGDTVIASFTLAIAADASPLEAAIFSNHAAGAVVGKIGTAIVTPDELTASFRRQEA